MRIMRWSSLLFAFVCALLGAYSAPHRALASTWEPDVQPWVQALVRGNLDSVAKGLRMEMDMQVRRLNAPLLYPDPSTPNVAVQSPNTLVLLRPYVGYLFREDMSAWIGYVYQPDLFDAPEMREERNIHEHRVFTQFMLSDVFGERFELSTRMRMEHRVRTHGPGSPSNDGGLSIWAHRLRLFERFAVRFNRERPWFAVASSETFFHLNETKYPSKPGIDQQRSFVGLGYHFGVGDRVELGYLNQLVRRYTDPHQLNHVVMTSVVISLRSK
jgi:hypothetical protein